jgi:hypothetical protein
VPPPLAALSALALALAWSWVLAAAGRRVLSLARVEPTEGLAWPCELLAGAWLWSAAALGLGLPGAFRPVPLLVAAAALAAGGRHRPPPLPRETLVLLVPLAAFLPVALAPPFFYDAMTYHLALPWQALVEGRLAPHPENAFSSFPPLAQLVQALPLALGSERATGAVHLASFLAAAAALAALAQTLGAPRREAWLCAAALPLLPAHRLVPGLAAAEGWTLLGVLASLALALGGKPRLQATAALVGFLSGAACAARLQGVAWSAVALALLSLRARRLATPVTAGLGWVLGAAPWWIKNLMLLGEATAPIGWRRPGIETLWRDASAHLSLGTPAWEAAGAALRVLASHTAYLVPLALAAVLGLAARRERLLAGSAVLAGIVAWIATGMLPRFLAPSLALLLALAAATGARARAGRLAALLSIATALVLGLAFNVRDVVQLGGRALLAAPAAELRARVVFADPLPAFAAAEALPEGARVLFVGEPRGYGFPRRFTAPSQHDPSPLTELLEEPAVANGAEERLRELGFTHLLVNSAELRRLAERYPVEPWRSPAGRERFRELLERLAPPSVAVGSVAIFPL